MAAQPAPSAAPPSASAAARLGRFIPAALRNWKVASGLAIFLSVAVIGGSIALTLVWSAKEPTPREFLLTKALTRLDGGEGNEARALAVELQSLADATFAERGGAMFILGMLIAREAQELPESDQRRVLYLVASRYLEQARMHGFPPGREAEGLIELARSLHHGGRFAQSVPLLREAIAAHPASAAPLRRLLALSYARQDPPRLAEAATEAREYLETSDLSPAELESGKLLAAQIERELGNWSRADELIAQLPAAAEQAPNVVILQAQVAIDRASRNRSQQLPLAEAERPLRAAVERLESLKSRRGVDRELLTPAELLSARAAELLGDEAIARESYERLSKLRFGRPDGLAATLQLAELDLREGRAAAAVTAFDSVLRQAPPPTSYENRWLPLDELRLRLERACAELIARQQFAGAVELAAKLVPLVPEASALAQQIAAEEAWARRLISQMEQEPYDVAEVTRVEARRHYRQAAALGERLATLRVATRHYTTDLAAAAENYRLGQGYRQAIRLYDDFLRQNPVQGQPEALLGRGQAELTLGQVDKALATLKQCQEEFPTHPASYRARLLESNAWKERGDLAKAEGLLLDNLYKHALTPQAIDWRDSIYALGMLLVRRATEEEALSRKTGIDDGNSEQSKDALAKLEQSYLTFQEAIRVLSEAVQRYPTAPQVMAARYWIAESYRHSALWPRKKLAVTNIETSRLALNRQIQQELEAALAEYQRLLTELSDEKRSAHQSPAEQAMLRNCYFGRADALFDLGRYEEAIASYSAATNRYQHEPESLEAYVQIAACYRRLKRPGEARGTIEQARVVLQRLQPDADYLRTTRLDREEWNEFLNWLRTL
jgi:TolA-binding protein